MENNILEIIVRVLAGEAVKDDKQKLMAWLGESEDNLNAFKQAESIWNALEIMATGRNYSAESAFERFKSLAKKEIPLVKSRKPVKSMDWIIRIAASIVIISGISYFMLKPGEGNASVEDYISEVVAPRGSKAQVLLPDGTRVWLNADSKIQYHGDYNKKSREIYLEGEGYFEVAKNRARPFVVSTADIRIRALGTSFNVKSYPGEGTVEATLIEGKVELEKLSANNKEEKLLTLKPNQMVTYYKSNAAITEAQSTGKSGANVKTSAQGSVKPQVVLSDQVNAEQTIAWKNNRLYFENETFQSLAVKLERRFGVDIHFMDDEIRQYPFSGRFDDIIFEQVLAALQFASPFYYTVSDKDVYISNKPIKDIQINQRPME
jgi:transmembrane sensor